MGDNCIAFTKKMTKMLAAGNKGAPAEQQATPTGVPETQIVEGLR
jgi:hypothetical protein